MAGLQPGSSAYEVKLNDAENMKSKGVFLFAPVFALLGTTFMRNQLMALNGTLRELQSQNVRIPSAIAKFLGYANEVGYGKFAVPVGIVGGLIVGLAFSRMNAFLVSPGPEQKKAHDDYAAMKLESVEMEKQIGILKAFLAKHNVEY
jgi:hypothetical protein